MCSITQRNDRAHKSMHAIKNILARAVHANTRVTHTHARVIHANTRYTHAHTHTHVTHANTGVTHTHTHCWEAVAFQQ